MRLPPLRLSVRWLMLALAVMAVVSAGARPIDSYREGDGRVYSSFKCH
jgi:hypothetical protein